MKLTNKELDALLADIEPFTIEVKDNSDFGSNIHRETKRLYLGPFELCTEIIIISSWIPSQAINEGGYLKYDAPQVTHVIEFEWTCIFFDEEVVIEEVQVLEIEARLQYLINII